MSRIQISVARLLMVASIVVCGSLSPISHATEALSPGHEIFAAYEKGDLQQAQTLLCEGIRASREAAIQPITEQTSRIDVEGRLGIGVTANVAAHALTLHKKHAARVRVSDGVVAEVRSLLTAVDQVIANASGRAETDKRVRDIIDYATVQKKRLLEIALDTMKQQGMRQDIEKTLAENSIFMEREKLDPTRWEAAKPKERAAQPASAGDVLKAAPEK